MKNSTKRIRKMLKALNLKFRYIEEEKCFLLPHKTSKYSNQKGDNSVFIVIQPNKDSVSFIAPFLYKLNKTDYLSSVAQSILWVQSQSRFLRYSHDLNDGEIQARIDAPIQAKKILPHQIYRSLAALLEFIDSFHESIESAVLTGKILHVINLPDKEEQPEETVKSLQKTEHQEQRLH